MPALDPCLSWAVLPAYIGPGAGLEFVSYFLGLLVWLGLAFSAVLLWPFYALLRRLRGDRKTAAPAQEPAPAPEQPGEIGQASP